MTRGDKEGIVKTWSDVPTPAPRTVTAGGSIDVTPQVAHRLIATITCHELAGFVAREKIAQSRELLTAALAVVEG